MASAQKKDYVDSIPEDCIQVESYNGKKYANLFYSPSEKAFYQAPEMKFRRLKINDRGYARPITLEGSAGAISISGLEKHFSDKIITK